MNEVFDGSWFQRRLAHFVSTHFPAYQKLRAKARKDAQELKGYRTNQRYSDLSEQLVHLTRDLNDLTTKYEHLRTQDELKKEQVEALNHSLDSSMKLNKDLRHILDQQSKSRKEILDQIRVYRKSVDRIVHEKMGDAAILLTDNSGKIVYQSPEASRILKFQRLRKRNLADYFDLARVGKQKVNVGDVHVSGEIQAVRKYGGTSYVLFFKKPLFG